MQTCTVECALGGDRNQTVVLENVTPPEVLILRRIHGQHAVEFRGEMDEGKHNHATEIQRLRDKYHVRDQMGGRALVFDMLFPGAAPQLPIRFSEIGFGQDAEPVEVRVLPPKQAAAPAAKKAGKKKAKAVTAGDVPPAEEEEEDLSGPVEDQDSQTDSADAE